MPHDDNRVPSTGSAPTTGVSERQARQVAEAARETEWRKPSFGKELFLGRLRLELIDPWPQPDPEQAAARRAVPARGAGEFARDHIDGAQIERDAWIPDEVLTGLAELGAFGMKIDKTYGGLGTVQSGLLPGPDAGRLGQPGGGRAALGAPVDRRAAAAQALRHRRAEGALPAPAGRG